jgi:hypothetical protein
MAEPTKETTENEKRKIHLAKRKKYRETHKEEIREKMRAVYQTEKEKRSQRIECECGACIRKDGRHRHVTTDKHQTFIKGIEPKRPLTEREKMYKDLEQVPCPCGGSYRRCHRSKHFWTNQHKQWLKEWMDNCTDTETEEGVPEFRPLLL